MTMTLPKLPAGLEVITPQEWMAMPGAVFGPGSVIGKPRIFAFTPSHPAYIIKPQTWASIQAAFAAYDGPIDWMFTNGDNPESHPFQNVMRHHNRAREIFLAGDYDYFLSVESDMIIPPDAISKLLEADADLAYGLYVFRHMSEQFKRWSAFYELDLFGGWSLSKQPQLARSLWGKIISVKGIGMGCTLIKRRVLEKIYFRMYTGREDDWIVQAYKDQMLRNSPQINPFKERNNMLCDDWFLAMDAQHYEFTQKAHLGVACGHVWGNDILWPDPDMPNLYRVDNADTSG